MSNIRALDKLRELCADVKSMDFASVGCDAVLEIADEIEQEITERYMELPVDADGVPIHVGDCLQLGDTRGEVVALTYCPANGKLPWEWQCDTGDWYNTAFAYHVKPRTVEDVLHECFHDCMYKYPTGIESVIAKYAEEIRGMMG